MYKAGQETKKVLQEGGRGVSIFSIFNVAAEPRLVPRAFNWGLSLTGACIYSSRTEEARFKLSMHGIWWRLKIQARSDIIDCSHLRVQPI